MSRDQYLHLGKSEAGATFKIPLQGVTETFGILAVKGAGKSNAAAVLAEEMYDHELPWVAVDPKGDWWGLRSSGDGSGAGLSIVVFGGLHGDVPLEPSSGNLIADLVVEHRLTCVLDVSEMTRADQRRFLRDFAKRLYRFNREPLHLFCEEADEYIPQMVRGEAAEVVGAFEQIVKRGRFRGIGATLITQRSASLNNDVLTQVGTLFAMRTTGPPDRKKILGWCDYHASGADLVRELPTLDDGESFVISPSWLKAIDRVRFRRRRTFDSGATPLVGRKATRPPVKLADVDLAAIKEQMADTIERAKADDPKELKRRIAELTAELVKAGTIVLPEPERIIERIEVPVIDESLVIRLEEALEPWSGLLGEVQERLRWETTQRGNVIEFERKLNQRVATPAKARGESVRHGSDHDSVRAPKPVSGTDLYNLTKPQHRILDALAWLREVGFDQPTKIQTGFIAGYRVGKSVGGTFGNLLGQLRGAGLLDYPVSGRVRLTDEGRHLAVAPDIERTSEGLQGEVLSKLTDPEGRVLSGIIAAYPDALTKQHAGEIAGYSVGPNIGGTFGNILGRLRTLGLIDYPDKGYVVACDVLFLDAG